MGLRDSVNPASMQQGTGTVGTTATQLSGVRNIKAYKGVLVKHNGTAADDLYVGRENVDATLGYLLEDGESVFIEIDDPTQIYVVGSDASVAYSWLAY